MEDDDSLELMVKYLLNMQLHNEGKDFMYSRDMNHKIPIPGISMIIESFLNDILEHLHLITEKKYRLFLDRVAMKIPFDPDQVEAQFYSNINDLQLTELTDLLAVNFLVGPIREIIQKKAFDKCINDIKKRALQSLGEIADSSFVQERLEQLYSKSDITVGLLYNLVLLEFLASKYGNKETFEYISNLVHEYSDELVWKLIHD